MVSGKCQNPGPNAVDGHSQSDTGKRYLKKRRTGSNRRAGGYAVQSGQGCCQVEQQYGKSADEIEDLTS